MSIFFHAICLHLNIYNRYIGIYGGIFSSTVYRSNFHLNLFVSVEEEKLEYWEKTPRNKDENQQQTLTSHDAGSGYQNQAPLVITEGSQHYFTLLPLLINALRFIRERLCNKKLKRSFVLTKQFDYTSF